MDPLSGGAHPNWVMLGIYSGGKYFIYASDELSVVELQRVHDDFDDRFADFARLVTYNNVKTLLTMRLFKFYVGIGNSYNEALRNLMNAWNPDDKQVKEIER